VERDDLEELHYITHVGNVGSIVRRGILCHRRADRVRHYDVSMEEVQDRRRGVRVPNGLLLHDYANVYITARNPMLSSLLYEGRLNELCVLSVSPDVLDLPEVVVTDRNAAASLCRFRPAAEGLAEIDAERVGREYWPHPDALEQERCRNAKFSEVLVPQMISPDALQQAYVGSKAAEAAVARADTELEIVEDNYLFLNHS
jgi:hypothetical protein